MRTVIAVHGVGHQFAGPRSVLAEWEPAMRDGLGLAAYSQPHNVLVKCAFYGDLFRGTGVQAKGGLGMPALGWNDIEKGFEQEFLGLLATTLSNEEGVLSRPAKARTPRVVQRLVNLILSNAFWAGVSEAALVFDLKQVKSYFFSEAIRDAAVARVAECVGADTRVIVGHSLGSIVAYEALCRHPEWQIDTLVTLGSPLGIPNLIFDRLRPAPIKGCGHCPEVRRWVNISDNGDIVALVKELGPLFDGQVEDMLIYNGASAHDAARYLTARETGAAIASAL
jgi:hypothetical protein